MEHQTSLHLINELISKIQDKEKFERINKDEALWYNLLEFPQSFNRMSRMVNEKYKEIYADGLIPILHNQEDLICVFEDKYLWIHLASPGWEKRGEYKTAEEVWVEKLEKDIDQFYT